MSIDVDYNFYAVGEIESPCCRSVKIHGRPTKLYLVEHNYSGCGVDWGACANCGKGYVVSLKVDKVERDPGWDTVSLADMEQSEKNTEEEEARKEYERLRARFEKTK